MDLSKIKVELQNLSERLNMESIVYGSSLFILTSLTYVIYKLFAFGKPKKVAERQKPKKAKQKETKKKSDSENISPGKSKASPVVDVKKVKPVVTRKVITTEASDREQVPKASINAVYNVKEEEDSGQWMQVTGRKSEAVKSRDAPQTESQPVVMKSKKVAALPDVIVKQKEPTKPKDKSASSKAPLKSNSEGKASEAVTRKSEPTKTKQAKVAEPNNELSSVIAEPPVNKLESVKVAKEKPAKAFSVESNTLAVEGDWEEAQPSKKKKRARKD